MRVAFTWYPDWATPPERTIGHTQWFDMPQVPAVGDDVSVGDPYVPILTVRRVVWVPDVGDEHEARRVGIPGSPPIDVEWHVEIWLART